MRLTGTILILMACTAPAVAQEAGDPHRGLGFAKGYCSECHAVGPNETVSPSPGLASFNTIANTPGMTGAALTVWLQTPHGRMPSFVISRQDRDDVVAYILSLKDPPVR